MERFLTSLLLVIPLAAILASAAADASPSEAPVSPRFCIVPIGDGAPTGAGHRSAWQMVQVVFEIPGLPAPVLTPPSRHASTINADRQLVRYKGPFPRSYLDHWDQEPWSGRVVANTYGGGISVLEPGSERFHPVGLGAAEDVPLFNGPYLLPRRNLTIITADGLPYAVEGRRLRPWLTREELEAVGLSGINSLHDAPSLGVTVVLGSDGNLYVFTDDGFWQRVGKLDEEDYGSVFDARAVEAAVFRATESVIVIRRRGLRFTATRFAATRYADFHPSKLLGQLLRFDDGGLFDRRKRWRRLGQTGFEDIPGGDIGLARPDMYPQGRITELPSLGRVLLHGASGLYLYDGARITPIADSGVERLGELPRIADLPSIGRVLVAARTGLFEITRDGQLVERPVPFPTDGLPGSRIADWPEAGVALVAAKDGVYALDRDLRATIVPGGRLIGHGWGDFAKGTVAATGDRLLLGETGLFLAVDTQSSGRAACGDARTARPTVPGQQSSSNDRPLDR